MLKEKGLIILGTGLVILGFFAGFKIGDFLFKNQNIDSNSENLLAGNSIPTSTPQEAEVEKINFCPEEFFLNLNKDDKNLCFQKPKIAEEKGAAIDLTSSKALLYEQGKLIKIFSLSYQSPENKWFQAPTGYFRVGAKHEKHLSSLFPVIMPYSVQFYEDFFIHGIPYYKDGTDVSSDFTGGCLRFENNIAKQIYDFLETGNQIIVYKTFDDLEIKQGFHPPVDLDKSWIRQRFLNPLRKFRYFGGTAFLNLDYYHHAGTDFAPNPDENNLSVYAVADGQIVKIVSLNNEPDCGLGNIVIVEHKIENQKIYSLYAHLAAIREDLEKGDEIKAGEKIGIMGNSGYGCKNYWQIGPDGCNINSLPDTHLHFEIKTKPVLENPDKGAACEKKSGEKEFCCGYTPDYPEKYGYLNPIEFLFEKRSQSTNSSESTNIYE